MQIEFKPSRIMRTSLFLIHALAACCLLIADLPHWAVWSGLLLIAFGAVYCLRPVPAISLRLEADCDGPVASVLPESHASPSLCVLRYQVQEDRRARTRLVLPDNKAVDDFRRLRVWLRWRALV